MKTGSTSDDSRYGSFVSHLQQIGAARHSIATTMKQELFDAEFNNKPLSQQAQNQAAACNAVMGEADGMNGQGGG
jgi:hypothetical protein